MCLEKDTSSSCVKNKSVKVLCLSRAENLS